MQLGPELTELPVADVLGVLGDALRDHGSAVLVAPPGAGKTTLAPLWLLDQPWLASMERPRIVMLEPRRLATRAAAQRMAAILGERVGDTVGYQTRDERHIGPRTRLEVVTEGVLTRRLQHDPTLAGVGLVVFDEVHERNLPTDLGLALALDVRATVRPDLRLLAMSATPDVAGLHRVLKDAPEITSDGRLHPVEIRWLPMTRGDRVEQATAAAVGRALRDETGDLLVFLPGIGEIRRVHQLLAGAVPAEVDVLMLAGALSLAEQDEALAPSRAGRRRVVLSTDIAESSLTVAGVRVVVDAGLARVPRHDPRTGMTRLTTVPTSRASADQRAGRAGRTEPGVAYRLWSKLEHAARRAHLEAEITQVDLAGLALELAVWGSPASELPFIDPPPVRAMRHAVEVLTDLGAVDGDGRPTDAGRRMLALPVHPRLAHMVDAAREHDGALACVIAASLDERDVLRGRIDELPADLAVRVAAVCGLHAHDRADPRDVRRVRERAADLARRAGIGFDLDAVRPDRSGAVLVAAFPDRVAVRRGQPGQFQLRSGQRAWVPPSDPLAGERFVVAADLDGTRDQARIRIGTALDTADLVAAMGDRVERRRSVVWDRDRDDLVERVELRLGGMLLEEQSGRPAPGERTTAALLDRVRTTRLGALTWSPAAAALRARVAFARAELGDVWPDWSDEALLRDLDEWLAPFLTGATGAGDLAALDLDLLLRARLSWDQGVQLDEVAPSTLPTPSGRSVAIRYDADLPTAAVRVQDLFGLRDHPCVARGRVPLVLELLSPADRPVQITRDLPGFWAGSWAAVRKEMAGRYPKHHWPVDPSIAPPRRLRRED